MRFGSSKPMANSRRITSCSLANSVSGKTECIVASASNSIAVAVPSEGTSIQ